MKITSAKCEIKRILFVTTTLFMCFVSFGCKTQKPVDQMDREEKVAMVVTGEHELTDEEVAQQHEDRTEILDRVEQGNEASKAVTDAMQYAKSILPADAFEQLKAAQTQWESQGRGVDMNTLVKNGVDIHEAFAKATQMRAEKILEQVNRAVLVETSNGFQGYFRASGGQSLEIYRMDDALTVTIRSVEPAFVIAASGKIAEEGIHIVSKSDLDVALDLKQVDENTLELSPQPSFSQSSLSAFAPTVTAQYQRVNKGELNVFSF